MMYTFLVITTNEDAQQEARWDYHLTLSDMDPPGNNEHYDGKVSPRNNPLKETS